MKPLMGKADIGYFFDCYGNYLKSEVNDNISKNDEMFWGVLRLAHPDEEYKHNEALFNGYLAAYYGIGQEVAHEVLTACMNSYLQRVDNVLDLACGHGRGMRHLVNLFPNAKFAAADINRDGVDFCTEQFGAEGIYLPDDLSEYDFLGGGPYDVVWCGSLFTHYPRENVKRWITHICNYLSDNGIFVFTVHGRKLLNEKPIAPDTKKDYYESGYGFHFDDSRLYSEGHGYSIVDPCAMLDDLKDITTVRVLSYREACWHELHDVVSVGKPSCLPFPPYELPHSINK